MHRSADLVAVHGRCRYLFVAVDSVRSVVGSGGDLFWWIWLVGAQLVEFCPFVSMSLHLLRFNFLVPLPSSGLVAGALGGGRGLVLDVGGRPWQALLGGVTASCCSVESTANNCSCSQLLQVLVAVLQQRIEKVRQ
nr:unnamed protein product [Digitaria exilis]